MQVQTKGSNIKFILSFQGIRASWRQSITTVVILFEVLLSISGERQAWHVSMLCSDWASLATGTVVECRKSPEAAWLTLMVSELASEPFVQSIPHGELQRFVIEFWHVSVKIHGFNRSKCQNMQQVDYSKVSAAQTKAVGCKSSPRCSILVGWQFWS